MGLRKLLILGLLAAGCCAWAQTVSPVIVEYKGKAEGRISLVNNTLVPLAVVLEPKSFSITADGNGVYRELDTDIHLKLSSTSFRVDPGQTYYVFYSATAEKLPAWFCVYAVFSKVQHAQGLDVRILLPHTVYIYPKKPHSKTSAVAFKGAAEYSDGKVEFDLTNPGVDLTRVHEVRITSAGKPVTAAGFPMLPGEERHVEVKWTEAEPPESVELEFEHGAMKQSIHAGGQ
ncbi:MAG: hypothetical protein WCF17_08540 [Terracidiphilus sp.]